MPVASVPSRPGARVCSSMSSSDGGEQIDGGRDAASERLRRDVDAGAREARALPLDGLVLDVLVADRFDDERVGELAALDDLRRRGRRDDRVVVGARDGLVEALFDEDARGDDVEHEAARVADGGHHRAALRADAQLGRHAIEHGHARQVRRRRAAARVAARGASSCRRPNACRPWASAAAAR